MAAPISATTFSDFDRLRLRFCTLRTQIWLWACRYRYFKDLTFHIGFRIDKHEDLKDVRVGILNIIRITSHRAGTGDKVRVRMEWPTSDELPSPNV